MRALHILHCHSTFDMGGKELRAARLMNAFGDCARHTVISGMANALGARDAIDRTVRVDFPDNAPALSGKPSLGRYSELAHYLRRFDLILTYNWGALDVVMARRVFHRDVPPLVHHEDGFNADEADGLKIERTLYRRLAFPAANIVIVPSERLQQVAWTTWKQPRHRVEMIANGVDVALYREPPSLKIPGLPQKSKRLVVGTLAGLRAVKQLPRLVRAVAALPDAYLAIVGDGPERRTIVAEATRTGLSNRLILPGFLPSPHRYIRHFDIFALSSDSEQAPISVIEAMAAGLPIVSTDVGDVATMVSTENRRFIVDRDDEMAFRSALLTLARDASLRRAIGLANRERAAAMFEASTMIARYRAAYERAAGRSGELGEK